MADYPEIRMEIAASRPVMVMEIAHAGDAVPDVKLVDVEMKNYVQSASYTIIASMGTKQIGFGSYVPSGYTCVGIRTAQLKNVSTGNVIAQATDSATVTFRNLTGSAINPRGHDDYGYYYTTKATLICVRNGVLESE